MVGLKNLSILTLCCLLLLAQADWRGTRIMFAAGDGWSKALPLVNVDTGIVHNFAVVGMHLMHRTFRGHFGPISILSPAHIVKYIDATHTKHTAASAVTGGNDQIVTVVFESTRGRKESTTCTKDSTDGCGEIFVIESIDDGLTWGMPFMLPRNNSRDVVHRKRPSIVYDRETNALYIAYSYKNMETGESSIAMARKYLEEDKYEQEEILQIGGKFTEYQNPKFSVTMPQKHVTELHLLFNGVLSETEVNVLSYTRSLDKGKTWDLPTDLSPGDHTGPRMKSMVSVGIAGEQDLFILYGANGGAETRLITSKNGGRSWSTPKVINNRPGLIMQMRVCGETKALGAVTILFDEADKKTWFLGYYDHTDGSYKNLPKPFTELTPFESLPMIDCNMLVKESMRLVISVPCKNIVAFDDYNYDHPETK